MVFQALITFLCLLCPFFCAADSKEEKLPSDLVVLQISIEAFGSEQVSFSEIDLLCIQDITHPQEAYYLYEVLRDDYPYFLYVAPTLSSSGDTLSGMLIASRQPITEPIEDLFLLTQDLEHLRAEPLAIRLPIPTKHPSTSLSLVSYYLPIKSKNSTSASVTIERDSEGKTSTKVGVAQKKEKEKDKTLSVEAEASYERDKNGKSSAQAQVKVERNF